MKLEYEKRDGDRECVAMLISNNGTDLLIKFDEGWFCIYSDSEIPNVWLSPEEAIGGVVRKFYPGDKITITF